ncbi:MAG: flavin-dependent oxidoreductase [Deinococcales bacterium]
MPNQPILIAGAGPGGLSLALYLHQLGINFELFETVSRLKPLGVGINLLPHSVRVLHQLGLQEKLKAIAIQTSELHYYNKFGQQIWAEPRGLAAGYSYPQYSIHRGDLQILLFESLQERLAQSNSPSQIHLGYSLEAWQDGPHSITASFRSADGQLHPIEGAALIAADGIHSTARKKLYPAEGTPIYSGRILWRALSEGKPFLDGRTMIMAGHQSQKFVCYPISKAYADRGSSLINWIAELNVPDWQAPAQDWNRQVEIERFFAPFADWVFDWLDVPTLIQKTEAVYEYPLADRDPLPQWSFGCMTLLGDAAHPMYPIGSNGASQAILDAEDLSQRLAKTYLSKAEVIQALADYDAERRPATGKIVLLNRQNGPEQVMQLAEERAPQGFKHVHEAISQEELETIANRYKQAAGFSLQQVNLKAST